MPDNDGAIPEDSNLRAMLVLKAKILNSPEYIDESTVLAEIFIKSRDEEIYTNRHENFNLQKAMFHKLLDYQNKKALFKQDIEKASLYNKLIIDIKSIADSIAWRMLQYDRFLAELFISHPQTGALNSASSLVELEEARKIVEDSESMIILNDLTNFLRFGDITIVDRSGYRLREIKTAGSKARGAQISRQKQELEKINKLLSGKSESINLGKVDHYILSLPNHNPHTFHNNLRNLISHARVDGYASRYLTPYFALEIWDHTVAQKSEIDYESREPFRSELRNCIRFANIAPMNIERDLSSSAPFGIFPLSNQDCFDLMTDRLTFKTTLNLNGLGEVFSKYGITLKQPERSEENISKHANSLFTSPKGSREANELESMGYNDFYLLDGEVGFKVEPSFFSRITIDLFQPEDFVQTERFRFNQIKLLMKQVKSTAINLHLRSNETSIWR